MTTDTSLEEIKRELEKLKTIDTLRDTMNNLIELHEMQAPLKDIDAAIERAKELVKD